MGDLLRRRMSPPGSRSRYGSWDLAGDDDPPRTAVESTSLEDDWHGPDEEEIRVLMRRQWRLSLVIAVLLYGAVFSVMIASYLLPEIMNRPMWRGFSFTFLFAGVLIYPLTWVVAVVYASISNRLDGLD